MCFIRWLKMCGQQYGLALYTCMFLTIVHVLAFRVVCVQLMGEGDIEGTQLLPWQQLHQGSVAALDICAETRQVLLLFVPVWTPTQTLSCLPDPTLCGRVTE